MLARPLRRYLHNHPEPTPRYLTDYSPDAPFPRSEFFDSRILIYPGPGLDGHPVKLFGAAGACHSFVYPDLWVPLDKVLEALHHPARGFLGYRPFSIRQLKQADLTPRGWTPHVRPLEFDRHGARSHCDFTPYAMFVVLERQPDFDDSHGPERLAILFLGADGIASYDALFCQGGGVRAPFAVLLQDHGFGGNYDPIGFGRGSLINRVADRAGVHPEFLLVAAGTEPWDGYEPVLGVHADCGGCHGSPRRLYRRAAHGVQRVAGTNCLHDSPSRSLGLYAA